MLGTVTWPSSSARITSSEQRVGVRYSTAHSSATGQQFFFSFKGIVVVFLSFFKILSMTLDATGILYSPLGRSSSGALKLRAPSKIL